MKILIVSDAWLPQINGVVRTLEATQRELILMGHDVRVIGPEASRFFTFTWPFYPEIKLEFFARHRLKYILREYAPDSIHIATEGPLGWAARNLCLRLGRSFTTSYQTRFPEYLSKRAPQRLASFVEKAAYVILRRFHAAAEAVMVATASVEQELAEHHFQHLVRWSRGVDTDLFKPYGKDIAAYENLPRPILLNVGRIAVEKNLHAFLMLATNGSKVVIGDGPDLPALRRQYPDVHFLGTLTGEELARHYAAADLFVFPSLTETFGLVLLEAAAAGLRIAAYPAPGPRDLFASASSKAFAVLDADLQRAVDQALTLSDSRAAPRTLASLYSWKTCTEQFVAQLQKRNGKDCETSSRQAI